VSVRSASVSLFFIAAVASLFVAACASADGVAESATQPNELRSTDLPACLGQSQPIALFQNLPFADVTVAGATGPFLVDFATTGSAIDVLAFPAFLAASVFTLDYERRQLRRSNGGACDDATLTRAGLRALSTKGFYGLGSAQRKPMTDRARLRS
jgi:hypothetical protein